MNKRKFNKIMSDDVHHLFLGVISGISLYTGISRFFLRTLIIVAFYFNSYLIIPFAVVYFLLYKIMDNYDHTQDSIEVNVHIPYK